MAGPHTFFSVSATLMRHILVKFAHEQKAEKRGGQAIHLSLSEAAAVGTRQTPDLVALDEALSGLKKLDPRQSRIVELRFYGEMNLEEVLQVSISAVRRDWHIAHAWLYRQLSATT